MEHTYAQALWNMVKGGMTPAKAVHALRESLVKHGRVALLPHIGRAFVRIAEREGNKNDVVLTVARESDERHAHKEIKAIVEMLGAETKDLKTQVDDTIIGGWRLEGRGMLVDASYKNQLLELYKRVTNA
ncbi:MAG: F0F1 ATP synthase subunit delta [Candidatus Paceibacterota bacterium]